MIRLAVRCEPEYAEQVMANLLELAPNGVEEERGPGWVEYAIYGPPGEVPELGELQAAAGGGLVDVTTTSVPDDWADRWADFHRPIEVAGRVGVRPSWWEPKDGLIDVVVDPGRAFGTGGHPTTRLCLELLIELEEQVSRYLLARGAKLLVIACNSAASAGQEVAREIAAEAGVEVVAVIDPEAEIAAALSQTG